MPVATVTKLRPRDAAALDEVVVLTEQVVEQLGTVPGFLGGRLLYDGAAAWTLSTWVDAAAVRGWVAAHVQVSAEGPRLADLLEGTSWRTDDGDGVPTWDDARARWPHGDAPGQGVSRDLQPAGVACG